MILRRLLKTPNYPRDSNFYRSWLNRGFYFKSEFYYITVGDGDFKATSRFCFSFLFAFIFEPLFDCVYADFMLK